MAISGNLINAYFICPRKAWLFSRHISPDMDFGLLEMGRLISQDSYSRNKKEIEHEHNKFDIVKDDKGDLVIGEVKKSSKGLKAAQKQLLFYLYTLKESGVQARGELLIPKEKKKIEIHLTPQNEQELKNDIEMLELLIAKDKPPAEIKTAWCKNCAFNEFCWAEDL